jgi:DNA replication licensing factor MCM2
MIRASEAHARMHLREYVRDEDVDMAIRVFLSSFVGAQKTAVKRQMEQHFARYMTFNRDNNALLMSTLQQLVRTEISYQVAVHSIEPETLKEVRIPMRELQNKATEMGISEISTFLRSEAFAAEGFSIDAAGKSITKKFDQGSS